MGIISFWLLTIRKMLGDLGAVCARTMLCAVSYLILAVMELLAGAPRWEPSLSGGRRVC